MIFVYLIFLAAIACLRAFTGFTPHVKTSDGAIVMAGGIVTIGAMHQFPSLSAAVGPYFVLFILALLTWLFVEYAKDGYERDFYKKHLSDPIKSFAAGTWVAAISVMVNVISLELPALKTLATVLFTVNLVLVGLFLLLVLRNYYRIFTQKDLIGKAQGVMLHGCIALQSIAVAGNSLFGAAFPDRASSILIFSGLFFYVLGLVSLIIRYSKSSILAEWDTTNTIVFGGLSITGLALSLSGLELQNLTAFIWLAALLSLIAVETLDIANGIRRIRQFGVNKGLFTYQPAQWARNFTLGMFLTFTIGVDFSGSFLDAAFRVELIQFGVIDIGKFIVIGLLIIEAAIAVKALFSSVKLKQDPLEINS